MTEITVENVNIKLLKDQATWVSQNIDEASGQDKLGIGLLELLDQMILNAEENKVKEYLVTRTSSVVVSAKNDDEARAKFEESDDQGMVSTETTVEEN